MPDAFLDDIRAQLAALRGEGLEKPERPLHSPQGARVRLADGREAVNLCANNYLGLAADPRIVRAAHEGLDAHGYGMASVRFICGTQDVHKELEGALSRLLGTEDTILYSSCFDANGGVFETLLGAEDAVVSDELNHASIIDGIRLCKARRFRYRNRDTADLEAQLVAAREGGARHVLVVTDGVFSMDGTIADLAAASDAARRHGAIVMVDDSHGTGVLGGQGRGSGEHCGVHERIDLWSGTLGKALGGASGGYVSGRGPVIELLRQRSRPYLFSNSLAPSIAAASLVALRILADDGAALRERLAANARRFRAGLLAAGFQLGGLAHPIIPVMLGEARLAGALAARLLDLGVYVTGFSHPVVPHGKARIRTQLSAAHADADIDRAIAAFTSAGRELGAIA
jgi:glycine C-acetyltransferase